MKEVKQMFLENDMDKLLSVVVVTYNHEKYITKCLDSILEQKTNFQFEIVVADDCSTDDTVGIIRKTYGEQIRVIERKTNVGLCQNMYEAYHAVHGKYIFDCSGDDYLPTDNVLQKHVDFLENHLEYYSVSNWILFSDEISGKKKINEIYYSEYSLLDFLRGIPNLSYMGTIRNTFSTDNPEYLCKASKNNEEIQMLYYVLGKGKKAIIPEAMYAYCYRKSEEGENYCSQNSSLKILADYAKGFSAVEKVDKKKHKFDIVKMTIYGKYIDKICEEKDWNFLFRVFSILKWREILSFITLKVIVKLNNYQIPQFLLSEKRLIKDAGS